jgi:hypothetical protein
MDTGHVYISHGVVFDENVFPFAKLSSNIDYPIQGSSGFNQDSNHLYNLFPANVLRVVCLDAEKPVDAMRKSPAASNPIVDTGPLLDPASISGNES